MYEIDFLPVGDEGASGDAIAVRFTRPDTGTNAIVVIDAGFKPDGEALVEHLDDYYGTDRVDIAILTHPDADHIGGMGTVIEELEVGALLVHNIGARGGSTLPAAEAVDELIELAQGRGTKVHEPFTGMTAFGGALTILGPTESWYEELVQEQIDEAPKRAAAKSSLPFAATRRHLARRFLQLLPAEVPFDDAGGTNPRNNSSVVSLLEVDSRRLLFTGDAGVPALTAGWDWLVEQTGDSTPPRFIQVPHAGSRHNGSTDLLNLVLGPSGQGSTGSAFASVASKSQKHPSPRIANAYMRRGYKVFETRGSAKWHHSSDAPARDWGPATPLDPMDESEEN